MNIMTLEEINRIAGIFRKIAAEKWFVKDIVQRQRFGEFVVRTYQSGVTAESALYNASYQHAKQCFADAGPQECST